MSQEIIGGVRREWMYSAATAVQRAAGRLTFQDSESIDARSLLASTIPEPVNEIERCVLEGLIARAERAIRHVTPSIESPLVTSVAERAAALLRQRYCEAWTMQRLAQTLGSNRCTLTSEFRRMFGVGVHQFLVEVRLEAAEQRLLTSRDKVESIAQEVGFGTRKTLYDAYRRVRGKPLNVVRRQSRVR